jgi:Dihydroorotate dehydrogenase
VLDAAELDTALFEGAGTLTGPAASPSLAAAPPGRGPGERRSLPPSAGPIDLCGVELAGPILNASGTFDAIAARRAFGDALLERFPFHAFVSKTVTLEPRAGESAAPAVGGAGRPAQLDRTPNKGLEGFLRHDLPLLAELPAPLVVSVMGFHRGELERLVGAVGARPEVALIELNFSCPNVETGLEMGAEPAEAARAVASVRTLTDTPLLVKLSPSASDPAAVAAAAAEEGADGIVLINTLRGSALDPQTRRPWLGGGGGVCRGPR